MNASPSPPSAPESKPLARRIDYALDYLTQLRVKYQERQKLQEDNGWREGARETVDLLAPAITHLKEALTLARAQRSAARAETPQPTAAETSGWLFPDPAEDLIHQCSVQYSRMYWETRQIVDKDGNTIPYDADRERTKQVARLLANTFNRVLYREDLL